MAASNGKKRKRKKKKNLVPLFVAGGVLTALVVGLGVTYFVGRSRYQGKFLPNTYINNKDVSGMTLEEVEKQFLHSDLSDSFVIHKQDGTDVTIPVTDFDYKYDTKDQLESLFAKQDANAWFTGYLGTADYTFSDTCTYDKDKLKALLASSDWGSAKNKNAEIVLTEDGYEVTEAVQGDEMEYSKLESYLLSSFASGKLEVNAADSGCYIKPTVYAADLEDECKKLNKIWSMSITYDFDYTTEKLTGEELREMISVDENNHITADRDKCMKYVEKLAKKYDTYGKDRTFNATIQGKITVEHSDDAVYGWWIYQDATCDELMEMLEKGESVKKVKPVYYKTQYGFEYTGVPEAHKKNDDIGKTYMEVDLTNQTFWYYKDGELQYTCLIVSGQTTSMARTTLEGVYKLWDKQTNYRMKATNADGESWDTKCNYWNNVSICGIGMHDSTWRYVFGGNIYKWNGSHGCINMPYDAAKYIHDNVPLGTPVVMYYS
ncbi:MAG: L,D-transpeptidase/peptidoglycan binding protein [Ruminococcus sp.]|nr:L,D-transpeptidase/peptidoglycan binding protein [Ruminococcus sp.]